MDRRILTTRRNGIATRRRGAVVCCLLSPVLGMALSGCDRNAEDVPVGDHPNIVVTSWTISHGQPVSVQSESGEVTVSASFPRQDVVSNEVVSVLVETKIAPGFHIYGDLPSPGPFTPFSIEGSTDDQSLTIGPASIPETSDTADGKPIHRDSLSASLPIRFSELQAANYRVTIKVQFQACNDLVCLPPESCTIELPIVVSQSTPLLER
ncbi:protein-disulfide reductase DsbD domain-containing protein [Rhodopirellula bahusiensis]|uniref:Thiol:disulfide interchange protein DsbD N-terminal domain-containing protein n=1 Tax=Rhodopirellula bahusiensis TaxID=2014065 RepID=A0A2G1W7W6_9BACT|nr:hypothetical protein CEE69_11910 [Rhodopirellula bahusiensis]